MIRFLLALIFPGQAKQDPQAIEGACTRFTAFGQ